MSCVCPKYACVGGVCNEALFFVSSRFSSFHFPPPKKSRAKWESKTMQPRLSERKRFLRLMTTLHFRTPFSLKRWFSIFHRREKQTSISMFPSKRKKKTSIFEKKMFFWKRFWVSEKSLSVSSFFLNCYQVMISWPFCYSVNPL